MLVLVTRLSYEKRRQRKRRERDEFTDDPGAVQVLCVFRTCRIASARDNVSGCRVRAASRTDVRVCVWVRKPVLQGGVVEELARAARVAHGLHDGEFVGSSPDWAGWAGARNAWVRKSA